MPCSKSNHKEFLPITKLCSASHLKFSNPVPVLAQYLTDNILNLSKNYIVSWRKLLEFSLNLRPANMLTFFSSDFSYVHQIQNMKQVSLYIIAFHLSMNILMNLKLVSLKVQCF